MVHIGRIFWEKLGNLWGLKCGESKKDVFWFKMNWNLEKTVECWQITQGDTKKTGTFEKPNKNWRNPRKKIIDRNWTIKTCLLRDSNPNYQCLKITSSCRWCPPPRMPLRISKVPVLLCHPVCVWHALENATDLQWKNAYVEEDAIYWT